MSLKQTLATGLEEILFYFLLFFLPTQFGKHFWPEFSIVSGLRIDYLSPTLYFTDILVVLLLATWLIDKFQKTQKIRTGRNVSASDPLKFRNSNSLSVLSLLKTYLLICLLLLINILFSANVLNGWYHFLKFLEFSFIGYYVATTVTSLKRLQTMTVVLALSALLQSMLALAQFLQQGSIGSVFYFLGERMFTSVTPGIANASINGQLLLRPYGTLPHPNVLAGFLLAVMMLCLAVVGLVKKSWHKVLFGLCLLLGTGALLLTMSRVAIVLWIGLLFGMVIKNLITSLRVKRSNLKKKRLPRFLRSLAMVGVLFGAVLLLILTPVGSRLIGTSLTEESVVQREELMTASITLFQQHPIFGVGLGNFLPALSTVQKPLSLGLYLQPVHNIFLLVLTETGLIGFSMFVWFIYKTYKRLLINRKAYPLLILLTVILFSGLFDHYLLTLQQGQLLLVVILGLCWTNLGHRA